MSKDPTVGPAFPLQCIGPEFPPGHSGMTLRDWFAGQERLAEWDRPESIPGKEMCEALAGEPQPKDGWRGDMIKMLKWEAKWRSALKYIRADAMLAEREKGKA
jgi:hypothetical protein